MTISIIDLRIAVRLFLFFVALSSAAWNAKAQQYQVAAPATPTYTYQTTQPAATQPTYQVVQPAQYAQQPAAPVYYYQSAYAGMETTTQPVEAAPVAAAPAAAEQPAAASYSDPYGFTAWLNGIRASYGLGPVGYDANLSSWAAMNNAQQAARGLGHHVMGPARRQNSAMGGFPGIESMWMSSPAHRAALLDPTITFIGIAGAGAWWTFNAN